KFEGTQKEELIRGVKDARIAAELGRERDFPIRSDWEEIKDKIMFIAVYHKFTQNEEIQLILLSTGQENIVEVSPYDDYWGTGSSGHGKNKLGIILMEVRDCIKNKLTPDLNIS
ncbi:MAG TPA: NADAR family protein, partial [Chitinispirillaceae bacterium]|nr:NADAR family protein [Chitinispirillaceae bacterium]